MSAYNRGELSIEAYLVRIIAAICRKNNGEVRIKGELIDTVGEATALMKSWDTQTQELVLTVSMGSFSEVFRVIPEKQAGKQMVLPNVQQEQPEQPNGHAPSRVGSTLLDDDKLNALEKKLQKRRIASMLADELRRKRQAPQGEV